VIPTGELDQKTLDAVEKFSESKSIPNEIDFSLYSSLYFSVLIDQETLDRRNKLSLFYEKIILEQQEEKQLQGALDAEIKNEDNEDESDDKLNHKEEN
jgi:hypothetical protein